MPDLRGAEPERVLDHLRQRLLDTELVREPFDHAVVADALPRTVCETLVRYLPPNAAYRRYEAHARGESEESITQERIGIQIDASGLCRLDNPYREIWHGVLEWILSPQLAEEMVGRFRQTIERRTPGLSSWPVSAGALLARDFPGYRVDPHTDVPRRLLSGVFYLGRAGSRGQQGTSLYEPSNPNYECHVGRHSHTETFVLAKTIPYQFNSLLVFARTARSFHGVEPIRRTADPRDVLLYELRLDREPEGLSLESRSQRKCSLT